MSPLVKGDTYFISRPQLNRMKDQKKRALGYDDKGQKTFKANNEGVLTPRTGKMKVLKTHRFTGPLALAIFKTGDSVETENIFVYQGSILIEENEVVRTWISPSMEQYTEALWCDDDILLGETQNKETRTFQAFQIPGEPTNVDNWDWSSTDDENHTNETMVRDKMKQIAKEHNLTEDQVHGVIILDC